VTPQPCLLVVVAHPDDETFGCGSLLMHAAARGARTVVVCATRGEAGEVETDVALPAGGLGELRESELRAAAAALGVADVELLSFADSGLTGAAAPDSLAGSPVDDVVDAIRGCLDRHRPDVVVTLDGSDGHRDHVRVRDAVSAVVLGTAMPLYLQCLPRSLMHAWVRHHAADEGKAAYVELPEIGTPDEELTTILDTSVFLDRRHAAIALHRSQQSPFDGLPDDVQRAWLGREHLVRDNPPWEGGPQETELVGI
jgi:LmbE family N-acetylglucosaminyl deacetylase